MKHLPLIWSGIWRKPGRTILILLQVTLAFALFGVLQGMKSGMDQAVANLRADLLYVGPDAVGGARLPLAYLDRLRKLPGVKTVAFADLLPATYQKPTQDVYMLAIDRSDVWTTLAPEIFSVAPGDLERLHRTRTGVLVTADALKKYGWHIGEQIPLMSSTLQSSGSGTWVFDIVGLVTDHEPGESRVLVGNYDYFDEARAMDRGTVRNFYALISDPRQAASLSDAIDRTFANSPIETRTFTFREAAQQQMRSLGDLSFAIRAIVSAVLVALLFSISTMMMQTIRERTGELAVLKTLGFTDTLILRMVVAEAVGLCVTAALLGLALAAAVFPYAAKFVPGLSMPFQVIAAGLVGAVLVALISVAMPARMAARLPVVDALAGR